VNKRGAAAGHLRVSLMFEVAVILMVMIGGVAIGAVIAGLMEK
jgi:hypothetical protein